MLKVPSSSASINAVKGTLVSGLTLSDLRCLDAFEGDEYTRSRVTILPDPLSPIERNSDRIANAGNAPLHAILSSLTPSRITSLVSQGETAQKVEAEVYTWIAGEDKLEDKIWEFDVFAQTHARNWVGEGQVEHEHEYQIVDKIRSDSPTTTPTITSATLHRSVQRERCLVEEHVSTLVEEGLPRDAVMTVCKTLLEKPSIQFFVEKAFTAGKRRPEKGDRKLLGALFRARAEASLALEKLLALLDGCEDEKVRGAVALLVDAKAQALTKVGGRLRGGAAWPFSQTQINTFAGPGHVESRKTV